MYLHKYLQYLPETTIGSATETTVTGPNSTATFVKSSDPGSLTNHVKEAIRLALQSSTETPGLGYWGKPGWKNAKIPGDTLSSVLFGFRHKSNNKQFANACKSGEIVMSGYSVCKGTIDYGPSNRYKETYYPLHVQRLDLKPHLLWKKMAYFAPSRYSDTFFFANGLWRASDIQAQLAERHVELGHSLDPRVNLADIVSYLENGIERPVEHITVQEVLAKANAGDLDALTAFAEAPKTVQSVLDGFKLILKIFKDAKRKEFRIYATVPSREKRLASEAWARYRARQLSMIPSYSRWSRRRANRGKSVQDYVAFVKDRKSRIKDIESFSKSRAGVYRARALREIAEALSSVYLNVQYNIKPLVYTIEDSVKAIEHLATSYRRYGNGNTPVVTELQLSLPGIPEAKFVGTARQEFRCLIKRRYSTENLNEKINNVMTADVLVTGFELIKLWSIVFDWFFTIGDALRAIPWNRAYVQQASCISWKTTVKGHFQWERDDVTHKLQVDMERFERDLYNPVYSIGIYFRDNFGLLQQLAALAFAFQSVNGGIKKRYYQ